MFPDLRRRIPFAQKLLIWLLLAVGLFNLWRFVGLGKAAYALNKYDVGASILFLRWVAGMWAVAFVGAATLLWGRFTLARTILPGLLTGYALFQLFSVAALSVNPAARQGWIVWGLIYLAGVFLAYVILRRSPIEWRTFGEN